jgi:hypothetical protein
MVAAPAAAGRRLKVATTAASLVVFNVQSPRVLQKDDEH